MSKPIDRYTDKIDEGYRVIYNADELPEEEILTIEN